MSLSDHDVASYANQGPRCFFERLYQQLPDDDAATLTGWLDDPKIESSAIFRALREEGYQVGVSTVSRHRRGDCRCSR